MDRENAGYVPCACRDCMEIAIGRAGQALCHACEDAGCDVEHECCAPHAYCSGGETDDGACEDCGLPF